ncbi:MAG: cation transporter [Candidatus Obscuribacter sp.]|nr:cation transporter [Candidatus Obscuribacter sp.]
MTAAQKPKSQDAILSPSLSLKQRLYSPYVAMWLVVLMYCIKTVTKLGAGYVTNSPVFISDGYHNLADILQALAVMVVVYLARRPANAEYPLGKSNIEFFSSLAIGLSLLVLGLQFALQSLVGLLHYLPSADLWLRAYLPLPEHKPLLSDASTYPWLISIMAISGALSWVVSRYQIAVGRATGHTSLVADGEETASDGRIELIALVGIISQPLFGAPWLEYPPFARFYSTLCQRHWKTRFGRRQMRCLGSQPSRVSNLFRWVRWLSACSLCALLLVPKRSLLCAMVWSTSCVVCWKNQAMLAVKSISSLWAVRSSAIASPTLCVKIAMGFMSLAPRARPLISPFATSKTVISHGHVSSLSQKTCRLCSKKSWSEGCFSLALALKWPPAYPISSWRNPLWSCQPCSVSTQPVCKTANTVNQLQLKEAR